MLSTVLLVVLILLLVGAIPSWPHSRGWGYGPSGILGIVACRRADPRADRPRLNRRDHAQAAIVSFTAATSCLSVNGLGRKWNLPWSSGKFFSNASSA